MNIIYLLFTLCLIFISTIISSKIRGEENKNECHGIERKRCADKCNGLERISACSKLQGEESGKCECK